MRDNYVLRNSLSYYRKLRLFTQTELANAVGVSKNTISSIEVGASEPSIFLALAIASVLGVNVNYLFYIDIL